MGPGREAPAWRFHNPVRLEFGPGAAEKAARASLGERLLLVTSAGTKRRGVAAHVMDALGSRLADVFDEVTPNPDLNALEGSAAGLAALSVDGIVALGGGSVVDTAKVFSALLHPDSLGFSLRQHLTRGAGPYPGAALPLVAVPTTAGTGSEVTPFCTVWDHAAKRKHSLAGPALFPRAAVLDPTLTTSLPREVTIATGLDALSQAFEAIWNRNANPITDALATESARLSLATLLPLLDRPGDVTLRGKMLRASLLAGLAISNTRTALAHSISYPLTARYDLPHGLACSFTLPALLEFNAHADDGRLQALTAHLGRDSISALAAEVRRLLRALGVPELLRRYVPSVSEALGLVGEMVTPGRADNNLREADAADIARLVRSAFAELEGAA